MSVFMVLLRKEFQEIFREKRFPYYAIGYALILGLISYGLLSDVQGASAKGPGAVVPTALNIAVALFFFNLLALVLLTAFFVLDSVGKERDAGMLGLLLTSPAGPSTLLAAKVAFGLMVYAASAALGLVLALILGFALGDILLQAIFTFYVGPLFVLFVFLLGSGLLLAVVTSSSRLALAAGLGIHLPLFLLGATPLFDGLLGFIPAAQTFFDWTPFAAAQASMNEIVYGSTDALPKELVTLGVGLGCLVLAFLIFRRQEMP